MTRRKASLVQADFDRAVAALAKAGLNPEIIFDLTAHTVTVRVGSVIDGCRATWRERAPERV